MKTYQIKIGLVCLSAVFSAQAQNVQNTLGQNSTPAAVKGVATRTLMPEQIAAIRSISRGVLAAKKSGVEDATDLQQLLQLRNVVDRLVTAEFDPKNRPTISLQGQQSAHQSKQAQQMSADKNTTRADARAVAAQLRDHSQIVRTRHTSQDDGEARSAGLPIGEQRAKIFERLAQHLDTALAGEGDERLSGLRELQSQLSGSSKAGITAPSKRPTPTMQAMPAGYKPEPSSDDASQ